jgi:hypothetical protein
MIQVTWEAIKSNWKRYLLSSLVTFFSFFIFSLAFVVKDLSWDSLEIAGVTGAASILIRLVGKSVFEALQKTIMLLAEWISTKFFNK